jgi:dTDP-glucose pyrophosphorylase|tara:strand:+ start:245 stop:1906 length:1662 start_codon:yes stop_codon:yes gene_type:complete
MKRAFCQNCQTHVGVTSDWGPNPNHMLYYCKECDTELSYNFKFCILAAGKGTRNNDVKGLHKALLPLENRPIISHIIDKLDKKIEIVMAVGYKSEQIKSYLNEVYSDRKITYVDVDNYDKPGSGPGYSLLCCKDELQEPFIYTACDTIVEEDVAFNYISENWIGVSEVDLDESMQYCLVRGDKYMENLFYGTGNRAFVGMAGISDYEDFWRHLEKKDVVKHEYQVDSGLRGLERMRIIDFTWYDTGNNKSYYKTKEKFNKEIVANKSDEAIFLHNNKVVKYFNDSKRAKTRIERAKYLNGNSPRVKLIDDNMYSYDFVDGKLLSEVLDESVLNKFFNFCKSNLWKETHTDDAFLDNCKKMYEDKTKERLSKLVDNNLDKIKTINGLEVESIQNLLSKINWDKLYEKATPSTFHGDLQPENIIYNPNDDRFVLIDWREGFGNSVEVGDVYYDLSKLYHALLINGNSILKGMYDYETNLNSASVHFYAKSNLIYFKTVFEEWCKENDYDWYNVELLGILHYLNICTLYDNFQNGEYGKFLFLYGKYLLTKHLNNA